MTRRLGSNRPTCGEVVFFVIGLILLAVVCVLASLGVIK